MLVIVDFVFYLNKVAEKKEADVYTTCDLLNIWRSSDQTEGGGCGGGQHSVR